MKKLSEIGEIVTSVTSFPWSEGVAVTTIGCSSQTPLGVFLTHEQRRELARQLLVMFCKEWISPHDAWREISQTLMSQIESMIEEQGL